jgi:hypothetical protein
MLKPLGDTTRYTVKRRIIDTNEYSVVEIEANDPDEPFDAIACHWYSNGVGFPQSYGKPQWMVLPEPVGHAFRIFEMLHKDEVWPGPKKK